MQFIKNVVFFGSAEVQASSRHYKQAYEVAQVLAKKGYVIINGGGPGIMNAVTHGADEAGGETIAITFYPEQASQFEGRYPKNVTDKEIKTGNYVERTFKLLEHGDIYIVFKGGTGTLSEFSMAWCLARLYYGSHKPLILYGSFWRKIIKSLERYLLIRPVERKVYRIVDNPEGLLRAIATFEKEVKKRFKRFMVKGSEKAFIEGGIGYQGPDYNIRKVKKSGEK